ncbi:1-phosphatidylinositol 4,5-bisphosphate phosphodiesterase eta-2 [Liparis tanakae]|uniref:1-phosphatidylinositol 4,5-bisphosphate phosphodiesterase eta-2 n=1 Tax=Liparis tanakae TaxID=230148 RepID=A0A4Z2G243_9TELE|nr:1-phosphatidylinositol 4,5-bisphosphate phosphodiesterase eta-2 [Liparis tanakae]
MFWIDIEPLLCLPAGCSSAPRPPAPPPPSSHAARTPCAPRPASSPEGGSSSRHSPPSPRTAIIDAAPPAAPSNGAAPSPVERSGGPKKPPGLSRTSASPLSTNAAELFARRTPNHEPLSGKKTDAPAVPTRRALFHNRPPDAPVRRAKSEGHVLSAVASDGRGRSAVPEVRTDATANDRLWSKLEPGSHRDSVSSSSSVSSSDTVIDLSLPNLARRSFNATPPAAANAAARDPHWVACRRSALVSYDALRVSKCKSSPDLQQDAPGPEDELRPRPLQPAAAAAASPDRPPQRRHTWSRLYMEGLKQAAASRPAPATPPPAADSASMSKSLGDLTSDDISCHFESKYRSISRSFVPRPARDQLLLRRGGPPRRPPPDGLTERLRRLTDVEPLTASDFAPETRPPPEEEEEEEEPVDENPVRRTSSRSQSRVRYIANRAKKAQERLRVQGRSASCSLAGGGGGGGGGASPIEERGNPEGACCVARSPCSSLDLAPRGAPPPHGPRGQ